MPGSFTKQFSALCRKNWIILWRSKWINLLRCLILPIAYAAFFAQAQNFFAFTGVLGTGSIQPLQPIPPSLRGFKLVYTLHPTNTTSADLGAELLRRVFEDADLVSGGARIQQVSSNRALERECPENFNGMSECWAGLVFWDVDPANQRLNYTLRGDIGLTNIDVDNLSKDDVSTRYLPLQWAIDSHFINMSTGVFPPSPYSWEYTNETSEELNNVNRLNYLAGIRSLIVLAHFIVFLGVIYQLPGSMAAERSQLLTNHLEAMGCRRSARLISWHVSISAAYLPAWIAVSVIFQRFIYQNTPVGLMIGLYVVTGLSCASWTQLVVVGFANASTLAAIVSAFAAIVLAILALIPRSSTVIQAVLTLVFPPMFFVFFTKGLSSWERFSDGIRIGRIGPERDAPTLLLLIIAIIDIFLFPLLAAWAEHKLYGVRPPGYVGPIKRLLGMKGKGEKGSTEVPVDEKVAVEIRNLHKVYSSKFLGVGRRKDVMAIEDLSFDVPKGEILCLLGRNGASKSTTLHIIARLISATGGRIRFAPDLHMGIASQRDVLWDELNCEQHIKLWRDIKSTKASHQDESDRDLLQRCDLGPKIKFLSKNLSGGQKRKLQLACALAGGSNLLLLDEITSGLDPLSRRAIWKLISANRGRASVILTTHFLDEADYLGDSVAILQQPGKLLALDNPVGLKTKLGKGFVLSVDTPNTTGNKPANASTTTSVSTLDISRFGNGVTQRETKGKKLFFTGTADYAPIRQLVADLEEQRKQGKDVRYQVNSATLEQVFLDLNASKEDTDENLLGAAALPVVPASSGETSLTGDEDDKNLPSAEHADRGEKDLPVEGHVPNVLTTGSDTVAPTPTYPPSASTSSGGLALTPGRKKNYLLSIPIDASTIFLKRLIVIRRAWLLPLIGMAAVLIAASVPLFYMNDRVQTCAIELRNRRLQRMSYPFSVYPVAFSPPVISPPSALGTATSVVGPFIGLQNDNSSWVNYFDTLGYRNNTYGGVSIPAAADVGTIPATMAFEGTILLQKGQSVMNLLSNSLLNQIVPPDITGIGLGQAGRVFRINTDFRFLASPSFLSTALAMRWIAFFGLAMGVWPSFAVIYPTQERASSARANQYSNGATPVALWLGHLLFELPGITLIATLLTIIFATTSSQFNGLGYLWVCLWLYGISSTLYSYIFALFLNSALASWALVAGTNVILFMLYLASYLLILTYDKSVNAQQHITIMHYTVSLINPVPSILRSILVSINLFNLLCDGLGNFSPNPYSHLSQFGGPIAYMVVQIMFAYSVLVYVDSGAPVPKFLSRSRISSKHGVTKSEVGNDVLDEKDRLNRGANDILKVMSLSKRYPGAPDHSLAVDDVTFGTDVGENTALIGPNGAGKTTTLACIRGVELPSRGDVFVSGHSIIRERNKARAQLGVCPQFNAIDQHLTVSQHLWLYGRLKGVPRKSLKSDITALLSAAGLEPKADQLATSLSGGNQRKLSLAIALIGDLPVVLIDEFSSGVDPFSKREAWSTLAALTRDRAVVMTTHSMEEVDALSSKVAIVASKMLAVGTPASLKSRFATYEIHLPADSVSGVVAYLQERGFSSAEPSLATLTRISIPGVREEELGKLLETLQGVKSDLGVDVTLHEASTETAFLSIVQQHNVREEEGRKQPGASWLRRILGKE